MPKQTALEVEFKRAIEAGESFSFLQELPKSAERLSYQEARNLQTEQSRKLYNRATKLDAEAQFHLGEYFWEFYRYRTGLKEDGNKAIRLFELAAAQGSTEALTKLGYCYKKGEGVPQNEKKGLKLHRQAAEAGDAEAQIALASAYRDGKRGLRKNPEKAVKWFKKAAEQENFDSQYARYELGECYRTGNGVQQDTLEATKWYLKAAGQGHGLSNYVLLGYAKGNGLPQDPRKVVELCHLIANHENAHVSAWAQLEIAKRYETGNGVEQNPVEAVKWYLKAAKQENGYEVDKFKELAEDALYRFSNGIGMSMRTSKAQAAEIYWRLANEGYAAAQYKLAECYENGNGIKKNPVEAVKWHLQAAEQGHIHAKQALTDYSNGFDMPENRQEAAAIYNLLSHNGYRSPRYNVAKHSQITYIHPTEATSRTEGQPKQWTNSHSRSSSRSSNEGTISI
jgi:uncharacterized protein